MVPRDLSESSENYLKAIYRLSDFDEYVKPKILMKFLPYAPSTITITLQRLAKKKYIIYEKYKGVKLTEKGRQRVARILRNHRLWEVFLYKHLKLDFVTIHGEACRMEHVVSPETVNKLEEFLGYPKVCPHGNPIPSRDLRLIRPNDEPLSSLEPGEYEVVRIAFETPAILRQMVEAGILPGVKIVLLGRDVVSNEIRVEINGAKYNIPEHIASIIRVKV